LAPHARLNHRQPHWRTANSALRTLVLFVQHELLRSVRRPEFPGKPTQRSKGFHRVRQFDHNLMNVIAGGTFECSNIKAGRPEGDPRQHHSVFAIRATWPANGHGTRPLIRRESATELSVTDNCRGLAVMDRTCAPSSGGDGQYRSLSKRINGRLRIGTLPDAARVPKKRPQHGGELGPPFLGCQRRSASGRALPSCFGLNSFQTRVA